MKKLVFTCFLLLVFVSLVFLQGSPKSKPIAKKTLVQREVFNVKKDPALTAIGRISFFPRKQCTLTLVSEDIAITAGHCFLEKQKSRNKTINSNIIFTTVIFRVDGVRMIRNVSIKTVLKAKMEPDYAIVKLNKKIESNLIKPIKFEKLTLEKMRLREKSLGCAGFNGDKRLGDSGFTMTISRNIKIVSKTSSENRIDANCISTHGGSGGAFFEERLNTETTQKEYILLGVIWGVTDDNFDLKGEVIKDGNSITSITPVSVFYDELIEILEKNKLSEKN